MSKFPEAAIQYLTEPTDSPRLGRIATVGVDGTPHVVPVGFRYDAEEDAIIVRGRDNAATKKFRDVARNGRAAIVIDDLASIEPWRPRGVEVRGRADAVSDPSAIIRVHPDRVRVWGLGSDPPG